ncbi:MAG: hypothetical protein HW421_2845 [Ignavibacteria bacterium]|nr:hypothetical protein [Ignavibacteria bacterium]
MSYEWFDRLYQFKILTSFNPKNPNSDNESINPNSDNLIVIEEQFLSS